MSTISIFYIALFILSISILSLITNYQNIITLLIIIELLLLTLCLLLSTQTLTNLLTLNIIIIIQILTVAAAETATGLSLLTAYYRIRGTISINSLNLLRG